MSVESLPAGCVLDVAGSLARLGDDRELFLELVGFYREDAPRLYSDLRDAVKEKNAQAIRMQAHALKGLVAGCGGVRAANAAQKVETAGQDGDLKHIASLVDTLGDEMHLLKQALFDYSRSD